MSLIVLRNDVTQAPKQVDSNNQFKCNNYKILNSIINREDIRTNESVPHPMGYISVDN